MKKRAILMSLIFILISIILGIFLMNESVAVDYSSNYKWWSSLPTVKYTKGKLHITNRMSLQKKVDNPPIMTVSSANSKLYLEDNLIDEHVWSYNGYGGADGYGEVVFNKDIVVDYEYSAPPTIEEPYVVFNTARNLYQYKFTATCASKEVATRRVNTSNPNDVFLVQPWTIEENNTIFDYIVGISSEINENPNNYKIERIDNEFDISITDSDRGYFYPADAQKYYHVTFHTDNGQSTSAVYQIPTASVLSYDTIGGSNVVSNPAVFTGGKTEITSIVPTKAGYTFGGWYSGANGSGTKYDANQEIILNSNTTLYAKWIPNTYIVTYNGNKATEGRTSDSVHTYDVAKSLTQNGFGLEYIVTYNHNYSGSKNTSEIAIYSFKNWNTKADERGQAYEDNALVSNLTTENGGIVTLYAQWNSSSVTYNPTRTGYTFAGWYTNAEYTGERVDNNGTYTPTADTILYAKWDINNYEYTVNYLEKDEDTDNTNNRVLHTAKVDGNNPYLTVIQAKDEIIEIDGFYFDSSDKESLTLSEINENNIINIYYTKRPDLTYKVNYLEKDETPQDNTDNRILKDQKLVENQTFEDIITSETERIDIDGFNFDSVEKETIQITTSENIINLYYTKRTDLSYKVNYLEKDETPEDNSDNRILHEQKLVENKTFEEIINSEIEKIEIDGFNFDSVENETIEITTGENIINIYYTKRTDLTYKVNHLEKDGTPEDNTDNRVLHEQVLVENQRFEDIINSEEQKLEIDGFVYDSVENETIEITTGENIINVYYRKSADLTYTVNYLEKDETPEDNSDNRVLHEPKVVGNQTFEDVIASESEKIEIDGFWYDSVENENIQITTGENIINIYYIKRTDLTYRVNYLEKDETPEDNTDNRVLHEQKLVESQTFEDVITSEEEKIEINGFIFDSVEHETIQISAGQNIINIYYTKRTDLTYTVNYLEKENGEDVLLHEPKVVENQTFEDVITSESEVIDILGYEYERVEHATISITTEENIINIYYKKGKFEYTVEYYYENEIDESKTVTKTATYKDIIDEYENKDVPGYKFEKTENLPLKVTAHPAINVIKVYYVRDKFNYIVEYYYDGIKDGTLTRSYEALFKDVIDSYIDNPKYGYEFEKTQNFPLVLTPNVEENVINIYYKRKNAKVTVKYIDKYTGEEIAEPLVKNGKVFDEYDLSSDVKDIEGYTLVETPDLKGSYTEEEQTKTYYYAKNSNVIVKYLEKDEEAQELSEEIIIEGYEGKEYLAEQKEIENYTFIENTNNISGTMGREDIEVTFYYLQNTKVIVNYIDQNTKQNLDVIEQSGLVGDTYKAIEKDFENYILVEGPGHETVVMTKEEIVLNYYYVHISSGVVEKHIDMNTNEVLYSKVYEGNEGDEYKIDSKEFEGYDLVESKLPENSEGQMTIDVIEVKYYYERKTKVTVEYIDKVTGEKLLEDNEEDSTEVIEGHENNEYTTEEKEFKDYVIVKDMYPDNSKGTMKVTINEDGTPNTETVVKYYYVHISGGVIERHIDMITEKVLEEKKHEGNEADIYKTEPKSFEGYGLIEDKLPEKREGQMTIETIEVNYYYARKASVKVEYLDKYSGKNLVELIDTTPENEANKVYKEKDSTEIIEGYEGQEYKTEVKSFKGYKLVETSENTEGKMKVTEGEDGKLNTVTYVKYYYAASAGGVREQHIDVDTGKEIIEEVQYKGYEGDKYKTVSKSFEGYKLVEEYYPENAQGKMTKEEILVKYYYKKIDGNNNGGNSSNNGNNQNGNNSNNGSTSGGNNNGSGNNGGNGSGNINSNGNANGSSNNGQNNGTGSSANSNGSSNNNKNGSSSGNGSSNNGSANSNNSLGGSNTGNTPNTGDILPILAGVTILGVLVLNIVLWMVHKKRKNKKNFIK